MLVKIKRKQPERYSVGGLLNGVCFILSEDLNEPDPRVFMTINVSGDSEGIVSVVELSTGKTNTLQENAQVIRVHAEIIIDPF